MCFGWAVAIGRRGTGCRILPLRVEVKRPEANRGAYENHFGCPVEFGARHNRLLFRKQDLAQPFLTHNPDLLELVAPQLEAELKQQLADDSLKAQVKTIVKRLLAGQRPRLEDVALELRVSIRTLQRRLLEEGMTRIERDRLGYHETFAPGGEHRSSCSRTKARRYPRHR